MFSQAASYGSSTREIMEPPTANKLYGPFLVGSNLQCILYGITIMQFYTYFRTAKRDPKWLRALVSFILLVETASTGFSMALVYEPLILNFGRDIVFKNTPMFLNPDALVTSMIATPIQLFMAWRIRVLTRHNIIPIIIALLALTSLSAGFWTTVSLSRRPHFAEMPFFKTPPSTWLITTAVTDVLITATLVWVLMKKKSGVALTDNYLNHLILVTVQTGSLTAIAALADVILFLTLEGTTIYFIWNLSLSKLYTSSVLSSLNTRSSFKEPNALFTREEVSTFVAASSTGRPAAFALEGGQMSTIGHQDVKDFIANANVSEYGHSRDIEKAES